MKKRKRKVAKAKSTLAAKAPTTTQGAKVALTIKGPPKNTGTIPKAKSSMAQKQKMPKAGQGSSHEGKGPQMLTLRMKTSKMTLRVSKGGGGRECCSCYVLFLAETSKLWTVIPYSLCYRNDISRRKLKRKT